jgi:hypothetical protein
VLGYLWLPLGVLIFGVLVRILEHFCRRDDAGAPFSPSHNLDEAEIMMLSQHF